MFNLTLSDSKFQLKKYFNLVTLGRYFLKFILRQTKKTCLEFKPRCNLDNILNSTFKQ